MAKVEMYTTMWCGYCARARSLLQRKGVDFEEIDVMPHRVRNGEFSRGAVPFHRPHGSVNCQIPLQGCFHPSVGP